MEVLVLQKLPICKVSTKNYFRKIVMADLHKNLLHLSKQRINNRLDAK